MEARLPFTVYDKLCDFFARNRILSEIIRGSIAALILNIVGAITIVLMYLIIARQLGANQAGYFFLSFAIINIIGELCRYGFDNALVKYIAAARARQDRHTIAGVYRLALRRTLLLCALAGVALFCLSSLIAVFVLNKPPIADSLKLAAISLLPYSVTLLHAHAFQGLKKVAISVLFRSTAIPLGTLIAIYSFGATDSKGAALCLLVSSVLCVVSSVTIWSKFHPVKASDLVNAEKSRVLDTARRLFCVRMLALVVLWGGQILTGIWSTATEVAIFSIAQRASVVTSFILVAVNTIAAPKFAELFDQGNTGELKQTAKYCSRILMFYGVIVMTLILVFSNRVMGWFGPEFQTGVFCLVVLSMGQFVNTITGSVAVLLQMTGHETLLRTNLVVAALVVLLGGTIVIPDYGIEGASVVVALAVACQNLLGVWQVRRHLGINTLTVWKG